MQQVCDTKMTIFVVIKLQMQFLYACTKKPSIKAENVTVG